MRISHRGQQLARALLSASLALGLSGALHAEDFQFDNGQFKGTWTNWLVAGVNMRTENPNKHLVGKGFESNGKPKGGDGADTADDGDLDYRKGDVYSNMYKLVSDVDIKYQNFGVNVSARLWYDNELENGNVPENNAAGHYAANQPLGDQGFDKDNMFKGFMWLNAYAYGHFKLGDDTGLDLRVGRQVVKWGEDLFVQNINQINPVDYTTLHRAGADASTEQFLPDEMLWGKFTFEAPVTVEAFYQWKWRPNEYDPCGTLFSGSNLGIDRGCAGIMSNAYYPLNAYSPGVGQWLSNGWQQAMGGVLPRGEDTYGSDHGQWGLNIHYTPEALNTDFGAYYMRINSRAPYLNATMPNPATERPDLIPIFEAAGVPAADAKLSAELASITEEWVYPNGIRIAGLSAATHVDGWKIAAELSYTQDQPVQINTADMFKALTAAAGPIGNRAAVLGPGALLQGYDRFDKTQGNLNATRLFANVFGADTALVAAEAVWSHANLPSLTTARYGRGFDWGYATQYAGGVCSAVQNPQGCLAQGYYTRQAWGYRLKGQLNYSLPYSIVLSPSLMWGQDVHGYSVDNQLVQGRKPITLAITAQYRKKYYASLSYTNYTGDNPYDILEDKDYLAFQIGAHF